MMLLIVEYVSWFAFVGAGLLVAWVGADVLRAKLRKPAKPVPDAQDSGRGLAGPPRRMQPQGEVVSEVETAPESAVVAPPVIEPAEELVLPVTQAVALHEEEPEQPAEVEARDDPAELEPTTEAEEVVGEDMMLVRRDPSVRVFDAVVAPSERKVLTED